MEDGSSSFIVHKSCTELPVQMHHHPLHAEHPLTLIRNARNYTCNVCREKFYGPTLATFAYCCSKSGCDFILDLKCASTWRKVTENHSGDHPHQFSLYKKPKLKFECEACGEEGRYSVYICRSSGSIRTALHYRATSKQERTHTFSCLDGPLMALLKSARKCAVMVGIDDLDDDEMIEEASNADHPINPDVQAQQITNEDLHKQIKHFSHQHLLTLISGHHEVIKYDGDDNSTLNCDGCTGPISPTDAFYSCMQQEEEEQRNCHFFLHTNCARLPTKTRHRFHPEHLVTLLSKAPSIDGVFKCDICNTFSQGFIYNYEQCSFYLDLQCNFLPDSLKHEAHDHCLILNKAYLMCCVGCGCRPDFRFSCMYLGSCVFSVYCIKCVKLPLITRHKYDNHPLKLTDASVTDDDEYYCEICEGEGDPEYWFYSCEDCDFNFHPDCVLGRYPQIKLGSTYKLDAHPHPVTLVDKIKSVIPNDKRYKDISPCVECHEPCEGLVYECSECNINIHRNGCCNLQEQD
ncbi:uncharacterized protein LOC18771156 [Prunus persica]|uniref:uncharacterized protein LOC18771156 n=1 Tax=Prunus persica TaxID=3760 RepID=UPI0009AB2C64|nr:uncharacterized protein LOC18771156 [Prunus persica]